MTCDISGSASQRAKSEVGPLSLCFSPLNAEEALKTFAVLSFLNKPPLTFFLFSVTDTHNPGSWKQVKREGVRGRKYQDKGGKQKT